MIESLQNEANGTQHGSHARQRGQQLLERTTLARLASDEQYMHRRRLNIQNFGSGWLKPPGLPKTLHQLREEKREQEEHQEAMRREQLAQELAEAEAGGADGGPEDGTMDDVQLDGAQDLDDMIPEADDDFGVDDDDDDDGDEDEENDPDRAADDEAMREERQNNLLASRIRNNNDAFREALVRGDPDGDDMYGGDEELEEEDQGHMLEESDFAGHRQASVLDGDDGMGVDMDADLDDDIPEAESGGYEHTDSEAELSSSEAAQDDDDDDDDDDGQGVGFAPRTAPLGPPLSPTMRGRTSVSGPRVSMDLSNLLSQDESSFMDSSPAQGRRGGRHT